ncbi:hypothetical protein P851_00290 [Klebsiella aerogenes UCI 48]|nr:hypothetical protein P851_00290 [Klebsiella aerogenes UCI 48]EUL53084.1 hypothetical protein P850_00292 [Klebsiella aerogenes UCI 47]
MSAPKTVETQYLASAEAALSKAISRSHFSNCFELRLQVLEAASSIFGGFDLAAFHLAFGIKSVIPSEELLELSAPVVKAIEKAPIYPALALSILSRETLDEQDRKSTGAYHTDFRLAMRLAELASPNLTYKSKAIDPACGAGILLSALTQAVCGGDKAKAAYWLENGVCAADLSANSLRATLLSLASFTDRISVLKTMRSRWYCGDSLMADHQVWSDMSSNGFDAVIGNPPWEKIKLSRHEFLKSSGTKRHYGSLIKELDEERFAKQRHEIANYSQLLLNRYPNLGCGEPDLYIAFTDLFFELCKTQGVVAALLPGGLIRSQGTQAIRQKIINASNRVTLSIIDNRARFFSIDSRFKFLAVCLVKAGLNKSKRQDITLLHEQGTPTGLEITGTATINHNSLASVRPDLSLPEVRSESEWGLFLKIAERGISWEEPGYGWTPKFCREVDMTKERSKFLGHAAMGTIPLVEGRMVQAHRFGVKGHVSGTGRSALWKTYAVGCSHLSPQFWIRPTDIPRANQHRVNMLRAGFCDIAGQTNERSLMAALIPAGVVCGNKVPTILFPEDPSEERLLVWLSIVNSFAFDWMLRRVLTTTVNYFLLQSVPIPRLTKDDLSWKKLANAARELNILDNSGATRATHERMAQLRAQIDTEVALAYGLGLKDMELILQDFPLLDRGQIRLHGESRSTITRDTVLSVMASRTGNNPKVWSSRVAEAHTLGAVAYIPSEVALGGELIKQEGVRYHG